MEDDGKINDCGEVASEEVSDPRLPPENNQEFQV